MHFTAVVIMDSEDSTLPERVDKISKDRDEAQDLLNSKWKNASIDEVLADYSNLPAEICREGALLARYEKMLKVPLDRLVGKEFESYTITGTCSVRELLLRIENKDSDIYLQALLTPDCLWQREGWSANDSENHKLGEEWGKKVLDILGKYKDRGIAVLLDCDS